MSTRHRVAAFAELMSRYTTLFSHFWKNRAALDGGRFTEAEADFLPAVLSLQERPVSTTVRWTGRSIIALIIVALTWSILGRVDVIVNANGRIMPSGRVKTIASVDVARVRQLHVSDGQRDRAGDVLIELDSSVTDAERDKALGDQRSALLEVARATALIAAIDRGSRPLLPSQEAFSTTAQLTIEPDKWHAEQRHLDGIFDEYLTKLRRIENEQTRLIQALTLATERAEDYKALLDKHDVAHHAWLEKEQERLDLEGQLASVRTQRAALIAETRRNALDQVTEGRRLAAASREDALRSDARSRQLVLTAPIDGVVHQLTAHTVGGVVPAAQPLMQIVPTTGMLEVEAIIENKDIGFVQAGHAAQVKVEAFDYNKYGTLPATVIRVSRDAINDEKHGLVYTATLALVKQAIDVQGKATPVSPGMMVNVEIKTGDRRIIDFLLSPLLQHQHEALHER